MKELVRKIVLDGSDITYVADNPIIRMGVMYGILKEENCKVKINNRIYEQKIYNYMSSLIETKTDLSLYSQRANYIKDNGDLDINKVLLKFQQFMKHEYLEQYGLNKGYLLVFDFRKVEGKIGETEETEVKIEEKKKQIFIAYC